MTPRLSSLSSLLSSFACLSALAVACGGIADGGVEPASDAGASSPATDAGTRKESTSGSDGAVPAASIEKKDAGNPGPPTPVPATQQCPNGEPASGTNCTEDGTVCSYGAHACTCMTTAVGFAPVWVCGPKLDDGGAPCPAVEPPMGGSCKGFEGGRCDMGLSICVCSEDAKWLCSDG